MTRNIAALIVAGVLTATSAGAATYDCTFSGAGAANILSPTARVVLDSAGNATINTQNIQKVHGEAIPARVTRNSDKRLTVKWELRLNKPLFFTLSIFLPGLGADMQLNNPVTREVGSRNEYGSTSQGTRGACSLK